MYVCISVCICPLDITAWMTRCMKPIGKKNRTYKHLRPQTK